MDTSMLMFNNKDVNHAADVELM